MTKETKKILMIAGEASGDLHGAALLRAILSRDAGIKACGIGGQHLRQAGLEILMDSAELSVMGITEVLTSVPVIRRAENRIKSQLLSAVKPDLLILIDFPGFNLHIAGIARKAGVPVMYYIGPKIWAWRKGRIKKIKASVDHMALILPFEQKIYQQYGIRATYVGNPVMDYYDTTVVAERDDYPVKTIGLLPGSRKSEITTLLPIMLKSADLIHAQEPAIRFVVSLANKQHRHLLETIIASEKRAASIALSDEPVGNIFQQANFLIAASGTVTLEAAVCMVPMIIVYKMSAVSFYLGKKLIDVRWVGLASLIANQEVSPELLQDDADPARIADLTMTIIRDKDALKQMKQKMIALRRILGGKGAAHRAASIALSMINQA